MKTLLLALFLLVGIVVSGQHYKPTVNTSCTNLRIDSPKAFGYIPNDRSEGLFNSKIVDSENTYLTEPMRGVWSETIEKEQQTIITDKTIKEYIDWCKEDSNKTIIGWDFILGEGGNGVSGWASMYTVYSIEYAGKDDSYIKYRNANFNDPENVYSWWESQLRSENPLYFKHQKYIRCRPIKRSKEPTFVGFYEWLERRKQKSSHINRFDREFSEADKVFYKNN